MIYFIFLLFVLHLLEAFNALRQVRESQQETSDDWEPTGSRLGLEPRQLQRLTHTLHLSLPNIHTSSPTHSHPPTTSPTHTPSPAPTPSSVSLPDSWVHDSAVHPQFQCVCVCVRQTVARKLGNWHKEVFASLRGSSCVSVQAS